MKRFVNKTTFVRATMVVKYCLVPSCQNNTINTPRKTFIRIPQIPQIREKWHEAIGATKILKGSYGFVCEDHFDLENDAENWLEFKIVGTRLRIKNDVVPHMNLSSNDIDFMQSQISKSAEKRKEDIRQTLAIRKKLRFDEPSTSEIMGEDTLQTSEATMDQFQSTSHSSTKDQLTQTEIKLFKDAAIQTTFKTDGKLVEISEKSESSNSNSPSENESLYVPSSSTDSSPLKNIRIGRKETNEDNSIMNIEKNSRLYLGLPEKEYFLLKLITAEVKITYKNILITLKKIRLNDSHGRLSIEFGVSKSNISRSLISTLPKLGEFFEDFIFWPDARLIKLKQPIHFSVRYKNVQSVIDCLEIEIQTPSNAYIQAQTWSNFKKCNTVKYLISSTPHGLINFISKGYGGRTTDTDIVKKCGYLNILPSNCAVMADRGFKNISQQLITKNCVLVRPPSTVPGEKLSREEVVHSKRIAALRIHIERVIRRLREFKILTPHACVHSKLIPWLDCIIIIACGIVNVQGLLIK